MLDGIRANAQSFGVKLAFGLIIIVFVFWGISAYTGPANIVASVAGKNITAVEFQRTYEEQVQQIRRAYPDLSLDIIRSLGLDRQVLESLIIRKRFELESERTGVSVSPYDIRRYAESLGVFNGPDGKFDRDVYLAQLKSWNTTASQFEDNIRRDLLPAKFDSLVSAGTWSDPKFARNFFNFVLETRDVSYLFFPAEKHLAAAAPSEEDLEKGYEVRKALYTLAPRVRLEYVNLDPALLGDPSSISDEAVAEAYNQRRSQYSTPEQVKARHILVMVDENAPEADVKKAEERIRAIETRILNGADFADVARETGEDGTAPLGGDLGWFSHSQMVPAFADAAFALSAGAMSEPVRSRFGFHLIKVEDKKAAETKSLDDVREELRANLAALAARDGLQEKIDQVLASALGGASMADAAAAVGLTVQETELLRANELGSLGVNAADAETLMSAPADQVVATALLTDSGALVVKVVESLPETVQPLDEVREDLVYWLTREKSRELAKAEAETARAAFTAGNPAGELLDEVRKSQPFERNGYVPELGMSIEMATDIFAIAPTEAGKAAWQENAYIVDEGAVLVRFDAAHQPSDERWLAEGAELQNEWQLEKAYAVNYALSSALEKEYPAELRDPTLFERNSNN